MLLKVSSIEKNSLKLSEIGKNFVIFDVLRSSLRHFSNEVCKYFLKSQQNSVFVERLLSFGVQNDSKYRYRLYKNEDVELFRLVSSHSEVFLKQNAATFPSKSVMHSLFFRV